MHNHCWVSTFLFSHQPVLGETLISAQYRNRMHYKFSAFICTKFKVCCCGDLI